MKITFFCRVERKALKIVEFYKQDIEILRELGHEVHIATKFAEISWKSELIFVWWWTYAFWPVFIGKLLRKPVIITGTFNYYAPDSPIDYFKRPFWQKWLIRYSIENASQNIMVSRNEMELIKRDWKLDNLYYSPHIVDIEKYTFNSKREGNYIFSIIWTGKDNMLRKCLPEIIESAEIVLKRHPEVTYIIAGRQGDGFEIAKKIIIDKGIQDNVKLVGEISEEDKIFFLQNCLIYLQPSKYEGFGLAIAEAMACGAPVLVSNVGEVKNVVGDAGAYVLSNEPKDIAESTLQLIENKVLLKILGEKARKRVEIFFQKEVRKNDISNVISIVKK